MLVRAHSNIHLDNTEFDRLNTEAMRKRTNMLVLTGDDDFIFGKKVIPFFRARAAAPVATTTLGLCSCTCARPKEVVVWYTNGAYFIYSFEWVRVSLLSLF